MQSIRRHFLYNERLSKNARIECKEGKTYETAIGLNLLSTPSAEVSPHNETQKNKKYVGIDNLLKNITRTQCEEFPKLLINCMDRPKKVYKMYNPTEPYQLIIFDLETTDKRRAAEICQLSGITQDGHTYSSYMSCLKAM